MTLIFIEDIAFRRCILINFLIMDKAVTHRQYTLIFHSVTPEPLTIQDKPSINTFINNAMRIENCLKYEF